MTAPTITILTTYDAPAFLSPMHDPHNVRIEGMGKGLTAMAPHGGDDGVERSATSRARGPATPSGSGVRAHTPSVSCAP